ncbi:MAG: TetR/AcrR family transcriptional regulator [Actinobacteria bacterium]|nr:TetR/AcrR family transcriptional regulator [Actinomycetota bacterium]
MPSGPGESPDERASGSAPSAEPDASRERLLEAVRAEVVESGLDKLSATSVARRAGLARITLYRRGGDVKRLALTALTRETETIIVRATRDLPDGSGRDRLVELALRLVKGVAASDFVRALVGGDTTLLAPYLTEHLGTSQRALVAAATPDLQRGMGDGSVRRADHHTIGTVLVQALTPFALGSGVAVGELGQPVVDAEIRRLVDGYLRPSEAPAP